MWYNHHQNTVIMQNNIPVTVGVATYNSSKYIIDTLESIKAQTYPYLKLIVSDDCSTDNTIDLAKDWVEKNRVRFINVKILTVPHNTGVSANFNRIWDACDTEWEKDIAGDDLLLPNCIEDNMKYVTDNPSSIVVFRSEERSEKTQDTIINSLISQKKNKRVIYCIMEIDSQHHLVSII